VGYTQAIELRPAHAIYYANRAAAHIRLEEYGSAIADATQAIEVDPDYIKVGRGRQTPGAKSGASDAAAHPRCTSRRGRSRCARASPAPPRQEA
jgi:tetratricopeptide (TPR) repeat protein